LVGDTEADIITAKNHGVKVMVLCGIRDQAQLELYKPDLIVKDLSEAVDLVMRPSSLRLGNTASPQKLLISQSRTKVNTVENC